MKRKEQEKKGEKEMNGRTAHKKSNKEKR